MPLTARVTESRLSLSPRLQAIQCCAPAILAVLRPDLGLPRGSSNDSGACCGAGSQTAALRCRCAGCTAAGRGGIDGLAQALAGVAEVGCLGQEAAALAAPRRWSLRALPSALDALLDLIAQGGAELGDAGVAGGLYSRIEWIRKLATSRSLASAKCG